LVLVLVQRAQGFPAQLQITHRIVALDGLVQVGVKGHLSRRIREVSWFLFNHLIFHPYYISYMPYIIYSHIYPYMMFEIYIYDMNLVPMKIAIFGRINHATLEHPGDALKMIEETPYILVERPEHYPSLSESFKMLKSYEIYEQW
jgi:hypothetical protein